MDKARPLPCPSGLRHSKAMESMQGAAVGASAAAVGAGFYCKIFNALEISTHSTHSGTPNYNTYTLHKARAIVTHSRGEEEGEQPPTL